MKSSYFLVGTQAWDTSSVVLGPQGPGGKGPFAAANRDGSLTGIPLAGLILSSKPASTSFVLNSSDHCQCVGNVNWKLV